MEAQNDLNAGRPEKPGALLPSDGLAKLDRSLATDKPFDILVFDDERNPRQNALAISAPRSNTA